MHRLGVVLFSSAILSLGSAPLATAADMRVKAPIYKTPAAAVYNWTGCYVGGNIGYGWQKSTSTDVDPTGVPPFDACTNTGTGTVGGGQVGCDFQVAPNWVGNPGDVRWRRRKWQSHRALLLRGNQYQYT